MANPKVEIRPVSAAGRATGFVVWCLTADCAYADTASLKTEAQRVQRAHVRRHRMRQAERRALNEEPRNV